jgi:uncharacterized protein YuzE
VRVTYDPEADILYFVLRDASVDESEEVAPNIIVDFDKAGDAVAIEIGAASEMLDADPLGLKVELLVRERADAAE